MSENTAEITVSHIDDIPTLRHLIDVAHEQRRALDDAAWRDEVMTVAQHWGAVAGWLAQRIRDTERGGEPDMPDAMRSLPGRRCACGPGAGCAAEGCAGVPLPDQTHPEEEVRGGE